jgi:hypothetical protein
VVSYAQYDLLQSIYLLLSYSASLYTVLPFPRCLLSNIILLPLYGSLPCRGVYSYCAAGVVLNLDSSDGRAAISCRLNKELRWPG